MNILTEQKSNDTTVFVIMWYFLKVGNLRVFDEKIKDDSEKESDYESDDDSDED